MSEARWEVVTARRRLDHGADAVYERIVDVGGYPEWLSPCSAAVLESGEAGEIGTIHRLDFRIGPVVEGERFALTVASPEDRRVVLAKPPGGKGLELEIDVDGDDVRCQVEVTLRHQFTARFLGMSVTGVVFRNVLLNRLDQSVRSLSRLLASGA